MLAFPLRPIRLPYRTHHPPRLSRRNHSSAPHAVSHRSAATPPSPEPNSASPEPHRNKGSAPAASPKPKPKANNESKDEPKAHLKQDKRQSPKPPLRRSRPSPHPTPPARTALTPQLDDQLTEAMLASEAAIRSAISGSPRPKRSPPDLSAPPAGQGETKPLAGDMDPSTASIAAQQAQMLQEQIAAAQKRLKVLQDRMELMMQRDGASGNPSFPTATDSSELPEDQKRHEAYANKRLQAAIDAVRQRTGATSSCASKLHSESMDDSFISPNEAGYSVSNSPLQRPLMYDVYRDKASLLTHPRFITRNAAISGRHLSVGYTGKKVHYPGKRWERKGSIMADQVQLKEVMPLKLAEPPQLAHGLDRVLFNPGISWLQDPRTKIYNYDPRIRNILDFDLFDPDTAPEYITASRDKQLKKLSRQRGSKFLGSTSTMTGLLSHIYFLLTGWKAPDLSTFGQSYKSLQSLGGYTMGARLPASVKLVYDPNSDTYGIDNDKTDTAENYVLSALGKSMETMLVSTPEQFEKHSRLHSWRLSEKERKGVEAYHFTQAGKLMMRSQLDCQDPRLPRRTFDLKTRAVVAVRKDRANWVEGSGYQIRHLKGLLESYEREMFDMVRSTMLKYLLQVRIGGMDGIFVCYHNTATVFGFEYLSREQMATALVGSDELFDRVFRIMLSILENILFSAIEHFPKQSLTLSLEARTDKLVVIVNQTEDEALKRRMQGVKYGKEYLAAGGPKTWATRSNVLFEVHLDRWMDDKLLKGPLVPLPDMKQLTVDYGIFARTDLGETAVQHLHRTTQRSSALMSAMYLPNVDAINERERYIETVLAQNPEALERYIRERHEGLAGRFPKPPKFVAQPSSEEGQEIFERITKGRTASNSNIGGVSWIETPSKEIRTLRELSMTGAAHAKMQAEADPLLRYEALEESAYSPGKDA